jgi:hypothetical protein
VRAVLSLGEVTPFQAIISHHFQLKRWSAEEFPLQITRDAPTNLY